MSYLSLYRKWRPGTFADVLAQPHVTETLAAAVRDDRVSHAYLFSGPRGTGKTSTARILAKALNCEEGVSPTPCGKCTPCREIAEGSSLDVFEMDAASHTSVDDVREIRERIPFASASGRRKVYIIDEAHQLSTPAFNALLKILEEPPSHVIFVLCTTESHKLPATVVSRCQRFEFRRLPAEAMTEHVTRVSEAEGMEIDPPAAALISRHARGSVRDALSLLDQAAGTGDGRVDRRVVLDILGEAPEDVLMSLAEAVAGADIPSAFRQVEALVEQGWDARQLLRQLLEEFRSAFLVASGGADLVDGDPGHLERLRELARSVGPAHLDRILQTMAEGQADMRLSTHPRLTLEVALARAAACLSLPGDGSLVARLERLERALLAEGRDPAPARDPVANAPEPVPSEREEPPAARRQESPKQGLPGQEPAEVVADDLQTLWDRFVEAVKVRKRTTHALVKEGWPLGLEDGVLRVGFERPFHAAEIEKPLHVSHISAAAEEAFGRKLRLRAEVVAGGKPGRAPKTEVPAAPAESSPLDLVKQGLGAEVVEEVEH